MQLRLRGNDLAAKGQYDEALQVYQEALQHVPAALAYKLHSNMSLLALTSGDVATALSEASVAMEEAPSDFTTVRSQLHSPLAIDLCCGTSRHRDHGAGQPCSLKTHYSVTRAGVWVSKLIYNNHCAGKSSNGGGLPCSWRS